MSVVLAVQKQWYDGKKIFVTGLLTFSGNYSTGGDTLSFSGLGVKSSQAPFMVWINGTTGHNYGYVQASPQSQSGGKVKINTTASAELSAGAYPAAITGDTNILCEASFEIR